MLKTKVAEQIKKDGRIFPELIYGDFFLDRDDDLHFHYMGLDDLFNRKDKKVGMHYDPSHGCEFAMYMHQEDGHTIILMSGELDYFTGSEKDLMYFHNKYYNEYKLEHKLR